MSTVTERDPKFLTLDDKNLTLHDMADVVRGSSLSHVIELVDRHGASAATLLAEAGIEPDHVGDYHRFVRYTALAGVVGRAAELLKMPDFPLQLARLQTLDMLGPIAVLARNAETLESALRGVVKYLHVYSPAIEAELHRKARESQFEFRIKLRQVPYRAQMTDLSLGVIMGTFQLLCGPDFQPNRVTFRHPRLAPERAYTDHFGCAVRFEAERDALVFPTGMLGRPIRGGHEQAYALASRYLGDQQRHLDIDQHVFELVKKLMPIGQAHLVGVSRALMVHPRTLQRQLGDRDTTFEDLLDEARREFAEELLASPGWSLSAIAAQLGYTEQSTLTRSCRRWFADTPTAVRKREQTAGR